MITGNKINTVGAELKIRNHQIISGIDASLGGNDEGPNPHELVEAALAACTIQTCHLYANRKQWPLESTEVAVEIVSETKEKAIIRCRIHFLGKLSDEQVTRLLDIANKCPIHRMLSGTIEIQTELGKK